MSLRNVRFHFVLRALVVSACAGSFALAAIAAAKPAAPAGDAAKKAAIARGLYLTTIMGCNDCHTPGGLFGGPDYNRKLSGSELGWRGPWGVSFARNLTPDLETGLGYWSEAEIIKALRSGVRNDGSTLLPPMPWQNYAALTDADAHAIATYLMSLPAVKHRVPDAVPPGQAYTGPSLDFPPPPAWDAPPAPAGAK
jgi:mono/diheme cytochrome c family protein